MTAGRTHSIVRTRCTALDTLDVHWEEHGMLKEVENVKQEVRGRLRRWFTNSEFDLIVWYSAQNALNGFQLCYRDGREQKALTWRSGEGFSHQRIDDGEGGLFRYKMTPVLVSECAFPAEQVLSEFIERSKKIDQQVTRFVVDVITKYVGEECKG